MKQGMIEIHKTNNNFELCHDHKTNESWYVNNFGRFVRDASIDEVRYARQAWYPDTLASKQPFGLLLNHYRKVYEPMGGYVFRDTDFNGVDGIFVTYSGRAVNGSRGEEIGDRDKTYLLISIGKANPFGTCYTPIYGWHAIDSPKGLVDMG